MGWWRDGRSRPTRVACFQSQTGVSRGRNGTAGTSSTRRRSIGDARGLGGLCGKHDLPVLDASIGRRHRLQPEIMEWASRRRAKHSRAEMTVKDSTRESMNRRLAVGGLQSTVGIPIERKLEAARRTCRASAPRVRASLASRLVLQAGGWEVRSCNEGHRRRAGHRKPYRAGLGVMKSTRLRDRRRDDGKGIAANIANAEFPCVLASCPRRNERSTLDAADRAVLKRIGAVHARHGGRRSRRAISKTICPFWATETDVEAVIERSMSRHRFKKELKQDRRGADLLAKHFDLSAGEDGRGGRQAPARDFLIRILNPPR